MARHGPGATIWVFGGKRREVITVGSPQTSSRDQNLSVGPGVSTKGDGVNDMQIEKKKKDEKQRCKCTCQHSFLLLVFKEVGEKTFLLNLSWADFSTSCTSTPPKKKKLKKQNKTENVSCYWHGKLSIFSSLPQGITLLLFCWVCSPMLCLPETFSFNFYITVYLQFPALPLWTGHLRLLSPHTGVISPVPHHKLQITQWMASSNCLTQRQTVEK